MSKEKFELSKLNPNQIIELDGWKEKQMEIVKENPYQKITDNATFEIAKARRTALVSGRTTIEKQDKLIGSEVAKFRKATMKVAHDLIQITIAAERKQQEEVKRYEAILEEKRLENERKENERIDKITDQIKVIDNTLSQIVDNMTFATLAGAKKNWEATLEGANQFDYEEFMAHFDEMLERQDAAYNQKAKAVNEQENERLENLDKERRAAIDRIYREGSILLDNATAGDFDTLGNDLEAIIVTNEDFGDLNEQYVETVGVLKKKLDKVFEGLKDAAEKEKIAVINEEAKGLFDSIDALDTENMNGLANTIEEMMERKAAEHGDIWETVAPGILKRLTEKVDLLNKEIELNEKIKAQAEKEREELLFKRVDDLVLLGLVYDGVDKLEGFGMSINENQLIEGVETPEQWAEELKQYKQNIVAFKKADLVEQERQANLKKDKGKFFIILLKVHSALEQYPFDNQEMQELWKKIDLELHDWVEAKTKEVNSF